jgi:ribosomal protein S18 acetylase RimI-like enzyme
MALLNTERQVVVRPALRIDLAAVEALDTAVYGAGAYGPWVLRQLLDLHASSFFVAELDGRIVAYVVGGVGDDGVAWLLSLATAADARGRGVARLLTARWLEHWSGGNARCARLTVAPGNTIARRLYEQHGFVQVADEPDYFGPGERRVVLEHSLGR